MSKPLPVSDKILIVLQYWEGDKNQAMRLARLLADLEPAHTEKADFLFLSRFDCGHDLDTIKYVSRKFNTFQYRSPRRGVGWPCGCNELTFGGLEWFYHKKASGQIPNYKAAFLLESDGVPLQKDWIAQVSADWDGFKSDSCVAGAWLEHGAFPDVGHINGNLLMTGDLKFLHWLVKRVGGVDSRVGWDFILARDFMEWGWTKYPRIVSAWRTPLSEAMFLKAQSEGVLYWHGVKDNKGIELCRKHLL